MPRFAHFHLSSLSLSLHLKLLSFSKGNRQTSPQTINLHLGFLSNRIQIELMELGSPVNWLLHIVQPTLSRKSIGYHYFYSTVFVLCTFKTCFTFGDSSSPFRGWYLFRRFCTFKFVAILGLMYFNSASELGFHLDKLNRLSPISGGLLEITIRTGLIWKKMEITSGVNFKVSPTTDGSSDDLVPSTSPKQQPAQSLDGLRYDDEQYQLFAPAGAILFSTPESKAWKEKVIL
ncbi:hypothetical protein L2E82_40789 [Cichorium intybus]|uniref:Uncharacterized protein n=1 Tax=Cichorium intybus TaxID=13427 RepID=A0ACB9ANM9_CICIN|nr:hypothetical protein L2E82_40789 [Cichorium intybus]